MTEARVAENRLRSRVSKIEVAIVARYRAIASTDKLMEALAFPLINQTDQARIEEELDRRLRRHDGNHSDDAAA